MSYRTDSYGNAYFPMGVYVNDIPESAGPVSQVMIPGPNGRLMQVSIGSIVADSPVQSVFGRVGDIVAQAGDYNTSLVTEGSNLYFTEARARAAISITNIGVNTAATYNPTTGVLNIPTYSFTPLSRTITINGVTHDLSENRSWTITPTVAVTSFNARYGDVVLTSTDVIDALGFTPVSSISETDPTVPAHVKVISTTNISNWNYAYSWGNHAVAGYLTSYTETDPIYTASSWYTTTNNSGNWNTAFSWGNHSLAGYELASNKGIAGGYAALDGSGKIPASQLPSYVDDIVEYTNIASFPATGETGKIYVALDNNKIYRWSGTAYVEITSSPGSTDAVPEGVTNLYFTNTRARNAISVSGSLSYNPTTGVISYTQPTNISAFTNDSGYITGINSTMVVSALGYTPYNSSNPAGYISGITGSMVNAALGYTPYNSSNPAGYITGINSSMIVSALGYTPATSTHTHTQLSGFANATVYDLLGAPANGPMIRLRYSAGDANRYLDLGWVDNAGTFNSGLRITDNTTLTFLSNVVLTAGNYRSYNDFSTNLYTNKLFVNGASWIVFNNEEGSWGIQTRTTTSTANLGASLKNIFWSGGGVLEGIAFTGIETGGAAMEIRNDGVVWAKGSFRAPLFYDSQDTNYFIDPNSVSQLNYLRLGNGAEVLGLLGMGSSYWYGIGVTNAYTALYAHASGNGVQIGGYNGSTFTPRLTVPHFGDLVYAGSVVITASNYTSYALPAYSNLFSWNVDDTAARVRFNVGGGGDDYIIGHSAARGYFGTAGYGWHISSSSSFHVMSSGWVSRFGIRGSDGYAKFGAALEVSGDIYLGSRAVWLSSWLNQSVTTSAAPSFTGLTLSGSRPFTFDTNGGALFVKGDAGGWSMGTYYRGSSDTILAGFGAYGGGNSLSYAWIGTGYNTSWAQFTPSTSTFLNQVIAPATANGGDNGIRVGAVRGSSFGAQSGDYIMLYERVHIGYPSGWGAAAAAAPTYGLGVWGNIHVSQSNTTGGGIILADDGDIVDLNDAWCSMRFTSGVAIKSGNRTGSTVITLGSNGIISANTDVRAPLFYDSQDTSFYLDPNSTSRIATLNTTGRITINMDLGTNDYGNIGQHNMHLRLRKSSLDGGCAPRTLELGVLDDGTGVIQASQCGIGYNTLALNPVNGMVTVNGVQVVTNNGGTWSINITGSAGSAGTASTAYNLQAGDATLVRFNTVSNNDYSTMTFMSRAWSSVQGPNGLAYTFNTHTNGGAGGFGALQIYYGESGYVYAPTSFRAPIFYDSADTTYYVDPAGNGTRAAVLNGNLWINPKSESYGEGIVFNMPSVGTWGGLRWYRNGPGGGFSGNWAFGYFGNESNNDIGFHNGVNGWRLDHSFNMTVVGSVRAPIYYDSDNTSFYLNPWGTSIFGGSESYVLRLHHNIAPGDFSDALYVQNSASGHFVQIGMSTNDSDGQHHRVSLRAQKGTGTYEGFFSIMMRQSNANHTQRLTLNAGGDLTVSGNVTAYSDIILKENIVTVDNALEKVLSMRGVYYNKKEDVSKSRKLGVIAQEVREVLPEVVLENPDKILSVDYGNIVGVLIEAIKEQQGQIEDLKNQIDELKNR